MFLSLVILTLSILTVTTEVLLTEITIGEFIILKTEPIDLWDRDSEDQIITSIVFCLLALAAAVVSFGAAVAYLFQQGDFKTTLGVSYVSVFVFSMVAWSTFLELAEREEKNSNDENTLQTVSIKNIYQVAFISMVMNAVLGAIGALAVCFNNPDDSYE